MDWEPCNQTVIIREPASALKKEGEAKPSIAGLTLQGEGIVGASPFAALGGSARTASGAGQAERQVRVVGIEEEMECQSEP